MQEKNSDNAVFFLPLNNETVIMEVKSIKNSHGNIHMIMTKY
ncbi:hypothetical protein DB29_01094 [Shouchella clausii]|nr:hypothetical protein DB29_01094 [Shouchella clausii]